MSWMLRAYKPDGTTLNAEYTPSAPGGVVDGFRWSRRADGTGVQLRFSAIPSLTAGLEPRGIVQLWIDGEPVFWGPLITTWPSDDQEVREYEATGGDELLAHRYAISPRYDDMAVEQIVSDLLARYNHPALSVGAITSTGAVSSVASSGPVDLRTLIGDLAKQVGFSWGVDPSGKVVFGPAAGTTTVDYRTHGMRWLPVDGSEVVTKGIVFGGEHKAGGNVEVSAEYPGAFYWGISMGTKQMASTSKRLYATYEDPSHPTYGLEKAAVSPIIRTTEWPSRLDPKAPSGKSIIKLLDGAEQSFGGPFVCGLSGGIADTIDENGDGTPNLSTGWKATVGEPSGVYTWLSATWTLKLPDWAAWGYDESGGVALKVWVESNRDLGKDIKVTAYVGYPDPDNPSIFVEYPFVLDTSTATSGFYVIFKRLPANAQIRIVFEPVSENYTPPACSSSTDYIIIKAALGWGVMIPDAVEAAKSLVAVPYQAPHEVVWNGEIVPPAASVEITTASGTVAGPVEVWDYEYTTRKRSSTAKVGSTGTAGDAAALKLFVDRTGAMAAIAGASV